MQPRCRRRPSGNLEFQNSLVLFKSFPLRFNARRARPVGYSVDDLFNAP